VKPSRVPSSGRARLIANPTLWVSVALLAIAASLHYLSPQQRQFLPFTDALLTRHTVDRIIFVIPVVLMTHAFRLRGGAITLVLAVLAMLPRSIWVSPYPTDALVETAVTTVVGVFALLVMEAQARQRALCKQAASRLNAIRAVTAIVNRSLDLEKILDAALARVLGVTHLDAGLIYSLDRATHDLCPIACRGLSAEAAVAVTRIRPDDRVYSSLIQSGDVLVVEDVSHSLAAFRLEGLPSHVVVPLTSKSQLQGMLVLASRSSHTFAQAERDLLAAIGSAIGVAVENAQLYASIRAYARQMIQIQEDERARIARELHDETIQMLIVISRRLELLAGSPEGLSEDTRQALAPLQELIRDTQRGLRRFAQGLRPSALDHLGLVPAMRGLIGNLIEEGMTAELEVTGETRRLAQEQELALFRIAQEALTNTRRHAGALRATVELAYHADSVRLTVRDNGCGFEVPQRMDAFVSAGKLGLTSMDERARSLGGTLAVQSTPGEGTTIAAEIPRSVRNLTPCGPPRVDLPLGDDVAPAHQGGDLARDFVAQDVP
jgi:signal transduction histidine kinase